MELNSSAAFDPKNDSLFFASLPEAPAVVRINPRPELPNARPYLIRTANLRQRMQRLLGLPAASGKPEVAPSAAQHTAGSPAPNLPSKRLSLRELATSLDYRVAGSVFELALIHWQQARRQDPVGYREKLRLRPPALIKMNVANAYPRCYVTRRVVTNSAGAPSGFYFGPFPSRRAAENFSSEFLNLFKIRRCQIKIRRDPSFPGCIYSEMKMCLAPCFAGCTDAEYAAESGRVHEFLATCGKSLTDEIESQRESASSGLDFERAAELHKRLDKVKDVLRPLPELIRNLAALDAVILQTAAEPEAIAAFVVRSGRIAEPFLLRFGQSAEPRSAEEIFRDVLGAESPNDSSTPADAKNSPEPLADHLALLARWFYSKPRHGEIFFREQDWPYRKLIRACGRLLAPKIEPKPSPRIAPKSSGNNSPRPAPKK